MSNQRVLVVDDDKNICELIRLYLEKEGFSVVLAYDGQSAVELFKENTPSVVLLDVMLPKMDGFQVCREIRRISNIPIIMLTAKGETFDKVLGLELGADDYMVKPFENKELVARIKAVLRRYDPKDNKDKEVVYPNIVINLSNYELKINNEKKLDIVIDKGNENIKYEIIGNEKLKNGSKIEIKITDGTDTESYFINIIKSKTPNIWLTCLLNVIIIALVVAVAVVLIRMKNNKNNNTLMN